MSEEETEPKDEEEEEDQRGAFTFKIVGRRGQARDTNLKDPQATGRKRAAKMYPLDRTAPCEWQGLSNVGGGKYPIVGCVTGLQQDRHHGPDKSVVNNDEGNVWRICSRCHNRWHSKNNKEYDWTNTAPPPHKPRPQTPEETQKATWDEFIYKAKKHKKVVD